MCIRDSIYTANIITVNGILTSSQHQCIGKAAELFGNGIIKLSTSFTIEVRGIPYEKINDFRKYIEKENLETGGIGPRLRPVVSCIDVYKRQEIFLLNRKREVVRRQPLEYLYVKW